MVIIYDDDMILLITRNKLSKPMLVSVCVCVIECHQHVLSVCYR